MANRFGYEIQQRADEDFPWTYRGDTYFTHKSEAENEAERLRNSKFSEFRVVPARKKG